MRDFRKYFGNFRDDEDGVGTVWSIFWTVVFLISAGFVIDVSNAYRYRAALQATADSSALGGLMSYYEDAKFTSYSGLADPGTGTARAKSAAQLLARQNMTDKIGQEQINGEVVQQSNVLLGNWSGGSFSESATNINAVKVTALRTDDNGNKLGTLLLDAFTGINHWDVGEGAIAASYYGDCWNHSMIYAQHTLDLQSENSFSGEMCLHGQEAVDLQVDSTFTSETYLSSASMDNFGGTNDIFEKNPTLNCDDGGNCNYGATNNYSDLAAQLYFGFDGAFKTVESGTPTWGPEDESWTFVPRNLFTHSETADESYYTTSDNLSYNVVSMSRTQIQSALDTGATFTPNEIVMVTSGCSGTGSQTISFSGEVENLIMHTDCKIHLGSGTILKDTLLWTENGKQAGKKSDGTLLLDGDNDFVGSASVTGAADVQVGSLDGNCNGGGAKVISKGDINFASGLVLDQAQVITLGDVHFAAQSGSTLNGSQVYARGDVFLAALADYSAETCQPPVDAFKLRSIALVQ